jgi:hypothetical protein
VGFNQSTQIKKRRALDERLSFLPLWRKGLAAGRMRQIGVHSDLLSNKRTDNALNRIWTSFENVVTL